VGALIFDQMGRTAMAICLTGAFSELEDARIASDAFVVKETADRISRQLALENIQFAM
jgi:DNA-binding IclR family transcriptional regulator